MKRIVTIPEGATVSRIGKEVIGEAPMNILVGSERLIEVYIGWLCSEGRGHRSDSPDEYYSVGSACKRQASNRGIQNATFEIY